MKIKKFLFGFGVMVASSMSMYAQQLDLTLAKAIEIALAENPTMKVADKDIQLKQIADTEAWQALLPTVSATASLQHTLLAAEMNLGGNKFKMGKDGTNTGALAGTIQLPLFAPTVYQNMKLTKIDIELAKEQARNSKLDLVNQVTAAYYQMLLAQDTYKVMQESYKISKDNYDVINNKFEVGRVSEYDKISAEVQMRNMNSTLVSTQTALTLAELKLKMLMGINTNLTVVLNDKLQNYENGLRLADIETNEAELENNSTMRQLAISGDQLDRTLKLQRTNFMPQISLTVTGQYQSLYNNDFNVFGYSWSPSASAALSINIPIYKASNWTTLKKLKIQKARLMDTKLNTQRQLAVAAQGYVQAMASCIAQVESNKQAVVQAEKAVKIASTRYDVGRGTVLELNQSEVAMTQAQLTYHQSVYDYLINKAQLDYTLGRDTYTK